MPMYEPAWHLGGVVRSVSALCRGEVCLGHEVTVFTTDSEGYRRMPVPLTQPVDLGGVKVYYFKIDFHYRFAYSSRLRQACRRSIKDFDLVNLHSTWNYPAIPAAFESRRHGIPYCYHCHGSLTKYTLGLKHLKKWLYLYLIHKKILRYASALRYTAELERIQTQLRKIKTPSFIIPNGLDTTEFDHLPEKNGSKYRWGIAAGARVILFLGRLDIRKAPDLLLKAFASAINRLPETVLIFAGPDFGQERNLKNLAEQFGIASRVLFLGYVQPDERNSLLAAADLLTLVTHPGENFGNAAVEAMLAGVPVLLSEHVGICREVTADGAGMVVPLEVEVIAEALVKMLSDPDRLKVMGEVAAASARRRYNIGKVASLMAKAYGDILSGQRSPELSWSDP